MVDGWVVPLHRAFRATLGALGFAPDEMKCHRRF
jgi:hypothetical protein